VRPIPQAATTRRIVSLSLACVALAALLASPAQAEFYPDRPTYDYNRYDPNRSDCDDPSNAAADHGRCGPGDGPVFNSFTNTPSYGDERPFFDGRLSSQSASSNVDQINVSRATGSDVILRVYVNNDANEYLGYRTTATGAFVRVLLPTASGKVLRARAYIGAHNAVPDLVEDTADLVSSNRFSVQYVPGTARLLRGTKSYPISDAIVTTGAPIGDTTMNGSFPAGFDKSALIELHARIQPPASHHVSRLAWILGIAGLIAIAALLLFARTRAAIIRGAKAFWKALIGPEVWTKVLVAVIAAAILGLLKLLN
jgi:hypothetical protein